MAYTEFLLVFESDTGNDELISALSSAEEYHVFPVFPHAYQIGAFCSPSDFRYFLKKKFPDAKCAYAQIAKDSLTVHGAVSPVPFCERD